MMKTSLNRLVLIILLGLFSTSFVYAQRTLTILHMNDTHSHIEPERGRDYGQGGVLEQAAYIDSVRFAEGKNNVLLLHAGDFSQGTSYFPQLEGQIEVDVLNAMKFDAVALGNHEFDNGLDQLKERLSKVKFPVLCANYDFSGTPVAEYVKPYCVVRKSGMKIGIIGLLTDISTVVDKGNADKLVYMDPLAIADKYAAFLKGVQKCDLVICLTHIGFDSKEGDAAYDLLLAEKTEFVDIIVGGHSHTRLNDYVKVKNSVGKDVVIVTDGCFGLAVGTLKVNPN